MYSVNDLSLLRTLELPPGSGRTATALSPCEQPNLLALPAAAGTGTLRVYDLMVGGWVCGGVALPLHSAPVSSPTCWHYRRLQGPGHCECMT